MTKALGGSDKPVEPEKPEDKTTIKWFRVRKTWKDSKTQKGAYKILDNAKKCADQNPGYKVFDADGKVVYEPSPVLSSWCLYHSSGIRRSRCFHVGKAEKRNRLVEP